MFEPKISYIMLMHESSHYIPTEQVVGTSFVE